MQGDNNIWNLKKGEIVKYMILICENTHRIEDSIEEKGDSLSMGSKMGPIITEFKKEELRGRKYKQRENN